MNNNKFKYKKQQKYSNLTAILFVVFLVVIISYQFNLFTSYQSFEDHNSNNNPIQNSNSMRDLSLPISSEDDDTPLESFIDHVYLFKNPETIKTFNLHLEKNVKYGMYMKLYMPDVVTQIDVELWGPDGDGDGVDDYFHLAEGELDENIVTKDEHSFNFGASITGNYILKITCESTQNVTIHILWQSFGYTKSANQVEHRIDGYFNEKGRPYYVPLKDDTIYSLNFLRTNALVYGTYFYQITVTLIDSNDVLYQIFTDEDLPENNYESIAKIFVVPFNDTYCLWVNVKTDIPTLNLKIILEDTSPVGNGSDTSPENEFNITGDDSVIFQYNIPDSDVIIWSAGIALAVIIPGGLYYSKTKREVPNDDKLIGDVTEFNEENR